MFELAIQRGVLDALNDALGGSITIADDIPQADESGDDSAFPFITVGDTTAVPFDDDDSKGADCTVTIHVWSRYRGRYEVKTFQDEIYSALHLQPIDVPGFNLVGCLFEYSDNFMDSDGRTRHGVSRFRVLIQQ